VRNDSAISVGQKSVPDESTLADILMADQKFSEDVRGALDVNRQHSKQREADVPQ
jgi:hypothetical protein